MRRTDPPRAPQALPALSDRERMILTLLRDTGEITRSGLIRATGLSGTAVFRATEELAAAGLIALGAPRAEGRGQPSHVVSLKPGASHAVGVSVMTDLVEMLMIDLAGSLVCTASIPGAGVTRHTVMAALEAFLGEAEAQHGVPRSHIHAMGIAVAGYFVGERDLLNPSRHLDDWALVDLRAPFEAAFGIPVTIENIANASAVGEQLLGLGRRFGSFAYVNVASGFGGGLIRDGRLWRGVHGNAGEFAALLESASLAPPNLETLRTALAAGGTGTANVLDMIRHFDMAWPEVAPWVEENGGVFARLAYMIHATVDVEAVVLGGRLPGVLAQALAARAQSRLEALFPAPRRGRGRPMPRILPAEVSDRAAAVGAASIPLRRHFFEPIAHLRAAAHP